MSNQCQNCSGKHQPGAFPALNRFCNKRGKGQFASCCRSINSNTEKKKV